jgi:hypothetical protein
MVIIYDCGLTEPPSSIHCFRDVTLYSEIFLKHDNLLKCPNGARTMYWNWIKSYGAHDFIQEILKYEEDQSGINVGKDGLIQISLLNEYNYTQLIEKIKTLSGR